jgi:glutamine cyclotransferase
MKSLILLVFHLIITIGLISSCENKGSKTESGYVDSLALSYQVVTTFPHDIEAFTQGLLIHNGKILESTGQHGNSWIAEVDPVTGEHHKKVVLDRKFFGEGIAILNNKLYQLTYTEKIGFIYDATTYERIGQWNYNSEGWGITTDGVSLIMSDGSSKITFLDSATLQPTKTITVLFNNRALKYINELEYIDGYIFANVWQTNLILKIDPNNGKVVGKIDLTSLADQASSLYPNADVLNGIAYDPNAKALLVTGKLWPRAYLIKLN